MKIKLHQISDRPTVFEFTLTRADLQKLEDRFEFDSISCRAELTQKRDAISLRGAYAVTIKTGCDLCLEPVEIEMDREFDLVLVNEDSYDEPEGDVELSLRSDDVDYYNGQEISLAEYFEDQLLLDLPLSIKCSEDCLGICPDCGVNRNHESCRCSENTGNNPFSVLGDLEN